MSAYTIIHLEEIEDSVGSRVPDVEGRFARQHLNSEHIGLSLFRYAANYRSQRGHHHREQEEVYVVVNGSGRVLLDGDVVDVRRWDVVRVSPPTVRAWEAGPHGLELLAIGSDRPEGGDGFQVPAEWPDN